MIKNEQVHNAEFILSEGNGSISRDNAVVVAGENLLAGQLLQLNAAGKYEVFKAELPPSGGGGGEEKNKKTRADAASKQLAILLDILPESKEERRAVVCARMAEVVESLLVGIDETAKNILKNQFIVTR